MRRILVLLIVSVAALVASMRVPVRAQSPSADAFAVVSIKPNVLGAEGGSGGWYPGGRFRAVNISARSLLSMAFGAADHPLPRAQIVGGPSWLPSDRFDIEAQADSAVLTCLPFFGPAEA